MASIAMLPVRAEQTSAPVRVPAETRQHDMKSTRIFVGEIGFRNEAYDRLKRMYRYPWLYPQAFAIDSKARELFVMLGSVSGQNMWGWVQVYDLDRFKLKSTFSTGQRWHEGLIVRWIGAKRFLYTMGDVSLIRLDVTQLPTQIDVLEAEALPARTFSMMAFDEGRFALQDAHGPSGFLGPQKFAFYDERFRRSDSVTLSLFKNGGRAVPEAGAKMQGAAWKGSRIYAGFGAAYLPGVHKERDGKWQGTAMFDLSGNLLSSNVTHPDAMAVSLERAIGYRPTCVENEGVSVAEDRIYSIWVTLGPKEREKPRYAGKGVVLMQESFAGVGNGDNR